MSRAMKMVLMVPLGILAMILFTFVGGELVMLLWNWLLPSLFGWRLITFWQALAMLALCRILFGGLGWRGARRSHFRRGMNGRCNRMSPEERERFRQRMREHFGVDASPSESQG